MDVAISGTDGIGSLNWSMLRAPTVLKAPSQMDVAPWCYKWVVGIGLNIWVGACLEHHSAHIVIHHAA